MLSAGKNLEAMKAAKWLAKYWLCSEDPTKQANSQCAKRIESTKLPMTLRAAKGVLSKTEQARWVRDVFVPAIEQVFIFCAGSTVRMNSAAQGKHHYMKCVADVLNDRRRVNSTDGRRFHLGTYLQRGVQHVRTGAALKYFGTAAHRKWLNSFKPARKSQ